MKFNSILVANRGEIASRIIKTSQKLGLKSIAVYVDADKDAPFVKQADEAIKISDGGYLDIDAIINACLLYTSPSPRDFEASRMPSSA